MRCGPILLVGICLMAGLASGAAHAANEVESIVIPLSDLESSTSHTKKIARITFKSSKTYDINRCHQYAVYSASVCRDHEYEVVMDGRYGTGKEPRFARLRNVRDLKPKYFTCEQQSSTPIFVETYGDVKTYKCTPTEKTSPLFADLDKPPVIEPKNLTQNSATYLETLWAKKQDWDHDWSSKVSKELPDGTYKGGMATLGKACEVDVKTTNGKIKVTMKYGRVETSLDLNSDFVFGAFYQENIAVNAAGSGTLRPANVLLLNVESETTTKKYFSRNLMVLNYPKGSEDHLDTNKPAVYIGGTYCRRLEKQ